MMPLVTVMLVYPDNGFGPPELKPPGAVPLKPLVPLHADVPLEPLAPLVDAPEYPLVLCPETPLYPLSPRAPRRL